MPACELDNVESMDGSGARPSNWKFPFFTVWTAQQLSLIGSHVGQFALVWWITDTTGSATVLATATFVALLPGVFLSPFAGALVDRWSRRLVMIVADGFIALVAAGWSCFSGLSRFNCGTSMC